VPPKKKLAAGGGGAANVTAAQNPNPNSYPNLNHRNNH